VLENAGAAGWRDVFLGYHWLDALGNPIVWEQLRTPVPRAAPGEQVELDVAVRGAMPPGSYRLAFDLVVEGRYWLTEVGNVPLRLEASVAPRIERALAARGIVPPPANQEEAFTAGEDEAAAIAYLTEDVEPAPDFVRLTLDALQEGYAMVGGSIEARRRPELRPWAPGAGRNPAFAHPLVCPSVVKGVGALWLDPVAGLPTSAPLVHDPWLYDGRVVVRLRRRS
jgi:hypothetical protein